MTSETKRSAVPRELLEAAAELGRAIEDAEHRRAARECTEQRERLRQLGRSQAETGPLRRRARRAFVAWLDQAVLHRMPLFALTRGQRVVYAKARILELPTRLPASGLSIAVRMGADPRSRSTSLRFGEDHHARDLTSLGAEDLAFVADYFAGPRVWSDLQKRIDQRRASL